MCATSSVQLLGYLIKTSAFTRSDPWWEKWAGFLKIVLTLVQCFVHKKGKHTRFLKRQHDQRQISTPEVLHAYLPWWCTHISCPLVTERFLFYHLSSSLHYHLHLFLNNTRMWRAFTCYCSSKMKWPFATAGVTHSKWELKQTWHFQNMVISSESCYLRGINTFAVRISSALHIKWCELCHHFVMFIFGSAKVCFGINHPHWQ